MNSNNSNSGSNWARNRITDNAAPQVPNNKYVATQGMMGQSAPSQMMPSQDMPFQQTEMVESTDYMSQQGPPPVMDRLYIPGYLVSNIGRNIRAEFLIGNSTFLDKAGKLVEVGVNYFVIEDFISRAKVMCDLYSVRFVTIM